MMRNRALFNELHVPTAEARPRSLALQSGADTLCYGDFDQSVRNFAGGLICLGLDRAERVGVFLDKRFETVVACFGTAEAGGVFVPINPSLKPQQVRYLLRDCNVRVLVTSSERLGVLSSELANCHDLRHVVAVGQGPLPDLPGGLSMHRWRDCLEAPYYGGHRVIDSDMAAILYTSGSTGKPKGVIFSHRNLVAGAKSVACYLGNQPDDVILAVLPFSFDAGLSQLTTAFHAGARVSLLNYLLPRDALDAIVRDRVTGLTAVPPVYVQLAQLDWPLSVSEHMRYFASTGGRMPPETLKQLRRHMPKSKPFLMYGLTEAFRSTYLPPEEVERRPGSIGKAIPNVEVLVLREDGSPCAPNEPGELVHRGVLVTMGYWNDPERTAERYRPLSIRQSGLSLPEIAVFSGDTVQMDEDGFLYFIGRRDEMIKTSGYRVSPDEIEEAVYATRRVSECAAFGVMHPALGEAIVVAVTERSGFALDIPALMSELRERLPAYMVPAKVEVQAAPLPRNANGKIDRKRLSRQFQASFEGILE